MKPIIDIARALHAKVSAVDAFLVPFVHGNRDSHGKQLRPDKEAAHQIGKLALDLKKEIDFALVDLARHL